MIYNHSQWLAKSINKTVFRYWVFKKQFTPYEMEEKFIDQSCYDSDYASIGIIHEAVILPDNDILLGFRTLGELSAEEYNEAEPYIEYFKLSEIRLAHAYKDQNELEQDLAQSEV